MQLAAIRHGRPAVILAQVLTPAICTGKPATDALFILHSQKKKPRDRPGEESCGQGRDAYFRVSVPVTLEAVKESQSVLSQLV